MTTVYAIHAPFEDRLEEVKAEMLRMGAPTIRVVDCGDYYQALEGSHRLAAAAELGLVPDFVVYDQDDVINITEFDWFEPANWAEPAYPAGEVASELFAPSQARDYRFEA